MKRRVIVRSARMAVAEITDFVASGNVAKAATYPGLVADLLEAFDERFLPHRPEPDRLPKVYQARVPSFAGYVLWIVVTDEAIAVIAAFRPGLATGERVRRARRGMEDL